MQGNLSRLTRWWLGLFVIASAFGCSSKPTTKVSADSTNGTGFGIPGSGGPSVGAGGTTGGTGTGSGQMGTGGTRGGAAGAGVGAAGMMGAPASGGATSGGATTGGATFTTVYAILMTNCAGASCHVGAARAGSGLSLADKATAYMNLVNAASRNCRGQQRVVPGMPNASVLVQALQHAGGCAPAMPQGKPSLSMADINTIVAWITAGAMNN